MAFFSGVGVYTGHKGLHSLQSRFADIVLLGNLLEYAEGHIRMELGECEVLDTVLPVQIPGVPVPTDGLPFWTEGRQIILLYEHAKNGVRPGDPHETVVDRLHKALKDRKNISFQGVIFNTSEL